MGNRETALANLSLATAAKAAKRLAESVAPEIEPVMSETEERQEVPSSSSNDFAVGISSKVNEERLVAAGWSKKKQLLVLKSLLDALEANLTDANPNVRNKAAVELAAILGVKVSKQPEAQRIRKTVEVVRPRFARRQAVIDRPVTDTARPAPDA